MQVDKNVMDKNNLLPIYELWHKPFWQTTWFYVLVITFILVLVFSIVWIVVKKYLRKRKKKTAWEKALTELESLKKIVKEQKISPQGFYLFLTEIVKRYLFNRFGYDLFGKTDQEVILFLEKNKFNKELLESMSAMFQSMQLIKFANKSTVKEVMEKDLAKSLDLVYKTVPKE